MRNHVRMNVSVPIGLKERMRRRKDINWSAVASEAFEKALNPENYTNLEARYKMALDKLAKIGKIIGGV